MSVFTVVERTFDLLVRHVRAYERADADVFFSRFQERQAQQERAASFVVGALAVAESQARIRPLDRLAAARAVVRAVTYLARDAALSALAAEEVAAMNRQTALMIVHMFVTDADESILPVSAERASVSQPSP